MATRNDETKSDRLTIRLAPRDLEALRKLAEERNTDATLLAREVIRDYLDGLDPQLAQAQLGEALRTAVREQAER